MVVNAPTSNITSAAELAVGLLLATARNIAPASSSLKGGAWKRSQYGGVELLDKTVGIVGLGRIGALVAERLKGFGVTLLAYDPYTSAAKAGQLGARLVGLDELLAESRLHHRAPAEDAGDRRSHRRGGAQARSSRPCASSTRPAVASSTSWPWPTRSREGRVAGAGLDVFAKEPTTESPLFEFESVVVTPAPRRLDRGGPGEGRRLRGQVGPAGARRRPGARRGERRPAVAIAEEVRPGIALVEKLGRIFTAVAGQVPVQLDIDVRGEITAYDVSRLAARRRSRGCSRTSSRSRSPTSTHR